MAFKSSFSPQHGMLIPEGYLMIGSVYLNAFDQKARIEVYVFTSEDGRHQRLADHEVSGHRPIKMSGSSGEGTFSIAVPNALFERYFSTSALDGEGRNPIQAAYDLIINEPAPFGLKELLETAEAV